MFAYSLEVIIYTTTIQFQCLPEPLPPQYNGGLVRNPNFDMGLDHWNEFGDAKMMPRKSKTDKGSETVSAFYTSTNYHTVLIGSVVAKSGCWSMLKGGFTAYENMKAELHFSTNNTDVELWIDSVSLKPFTKLEWQDHQNESINRVRKRNIRIHVTNRQGQKLQGAKIAIDQTRPHFLLGCSTTETILNHKAYQDWFTPRFTATTFNNEMKWYYTEVLQDQENYTVPDAMVSFFKKHKISIRGHTILWASTNVTQYWVRLLQPKDILKAAVRRVGSVVSRYSGDVIGWDVMNENLHNSFYEEKLGPNASAMFYQIVRALDPNTPLFLNEYNTLEFPTDMNVIPSRYVEKIRETRSFPGNERMDVRIGLQGHFLRTPKLSHMRATLDVLGATNMPIWLTELDTKRGPAQAVELEEIMREAFAHPAIEGIIVWGGWKPTGCNQTCLTNKNYDVLPKGCAEMCLTDNNFKNLPPGDVVDKLIKEWKTTNVTGVTNIDGVFEQNVFLGEYSVTVSHPMFPRRPVKKKFNVTNGKGPLEMWVSV
ncbi:hypothetical protein DH2020_029775 [Rehmannia glutinosa]|uniref:GH10 domain-containing protein n=1 Tax=Rehmannia glutinosa TaxID=99300 RepID=A0ABR0VNH6_REHGL